MPWLQKNEPLQQMGQITKAGVRFSDIAAIMNGECSVQEYGLVHEP